MEKQRLPSNPQCEPWEAAAPHRRHAAKLVELLILKHGERWTFIFGISSTFWSTWTMFSCSRNGCWFDFCASMKTLKFTLWLAGGRPVSLRALGRALYSLSLHKLSKASSTEEVSRVLSLLLQAGCLADTRALHMSSVLYSAGLGNRKDPIKVYFIGALIAKIVIFSVVVQYILTSLNLWCRLGSWACWAPRGTIDWHCCILATCTCRDYTVSPRIQIWPMPTMQTLLNRQFWIVTILHHSRSGKLWVPV